MRCLSEERADSKESRDGRHDRLFIEECQMAGISSGHIVDR